MLLSAFISFMFTVVSCCCGLKSSGLGLWEVMKCDTVGRTAATLNVTQEQIERLNPGLMPWFVTPGDLYTVPYNPAIQFPATWSTTQDCTPVLHIRYTECSHFRSVRTSNFVAGITTAPTTTENTNKESAPKTSLTTAESTNNENVAKTSTSRSVTLTAIYPTSSILQGGSPLCYRDGKRGNAEPVVMELVADFACKAMINKDVTLKDEKDSLSFLMAFGDESLHHYLSIRWTAECKSPQKIAQSCSQIMYKIWEACK
jgi:spore germination protein YaaH